ncbi:hypothetical protein [Brevibacillus sp. SYSU BS000544]|uniref:hypothetical protein n=1 Tax=Brevibacillus sp. SYSU BS000544 TaxID=3416443 RepID=UPI003CE490CD
MGYLLLLGSLLLMIVGTWKCIGIMRYGHATTGEKIIWAGVTAIGIIIFFLLKVISDSS